MAYHPLNVRFERLSMSHPRLHFWDPVRHKIHLRHGWSPHRLPMSATADLNCGSFLGGFSMFKHPQISHLPAELGDSGSRSAQPWVWVLPQFTWIEVSIENHCDCGSRLRRSFACLLHWMKHEKIVATPKKQLTGLTSIQLICWVNRSTKKVIQSTQNQTPIPSIYSEHITSCKMFA